MTGFRFAPPVGPLHAHTHTHTHTPGPFVLELFSLSLSLSLSISAVSKGLRALCLLAFFVLRLALGVDVRANQRVAIGSRTDQLGRRHLNFDRQHLDGRHFPPFHLSCFPFFFLGWIARSSFIRKEIPLGAKKNKETTRSLGSCGHCTNTKTIDVVLFEPDNKWRWMCFCFFSLGSTIVRRGFFHVVQSAEAIHWSGRCWWGRLWRRSTRSNQFKRSALISFVLHSLVSAQKKPSK